MTSEILVVAFGGNALWPREGSGEPAEQIAHARLACAPLVERLRRGVRVLIVYGNGPQVGAELLRQHAARHEVAPSPLDVCVAATQGSMGYLLELALRAELAHAGLDVPVTSVATLVCVDPEDPAFAAPDKPVGPFYDEADATRLRERGWTLIEQSGGGFRRVVPSPRPLELVDAGAIRTLLDAGHVVLGGGGGGVPVVRASSGALVGAEAVIDKDHTAALLGRAVGARELYDLTTVDYVYRSFGRPDATPLPTLTAAQARELAATGEFPAGSMGPKIEAALDFLASGSRVLVTALPRLSDALAGRCGTWITR